LLPEFEEQLNGLKTGDQSTVELTFPDDYPNEEIAGQPAKFSIDVREVAKPKLPEIDEDFIKSFGVDEGTDEAFRSQSWRIWRRNVRKKFAVTPMKR
jgi:trigger factor